MISTEYIDALTGIYNRAGLYYEFNRINSTIAQVIFFDIDNFKTVNDMYGHNSGDEVLKTFATVLSETFPQDSIVVRLGGDEFITIIPQNITRLDMTVMLDTFLNKIRNLKKSSRIYEVISASIGVLSDYTISQGIDTALSCADRAMYFAKEYGKDTYVFYNDCEEQIHKEKKIETNAVKALDDGRFVILYHPVFHMHTSKLLRSEACCMWQMEDGTYLGRNEFRPILEKNGFIKEIDLHIFRLACADSIRFKESGRKNDIISIQLSYLHILDDTLPDRLKEIMDIYGVHAYDFEINVDEKAFSERISHKKFIDNLKKLKDIGFYLALSKFGEDFSSMKYLRNLPISFVRLDGEFIQDNISSDEGLRILKCTAEIGKGFKFMVVATRISDSQALAKLSKCGFDAGSGDYFCPKLAIDDYIEYLNTKLQERTGTVSYHFINDLKDAEKSAANEGIIIGEGIEFTEGINPSWGALKFPGGPIEHNYVKLPSHLLEYDSYSISMWLKPYELQQWVSAFYVRYQDGFMSFMPHVPGGRSIYRINKDEYLDLWHDAITGTLGIDKWVYVAFTFDAFTQISRLYINGELASTVFEVSALKLPKEVWLGGDNFQVSYSGLISGLQIDIGSMTGDDIRERYKSFLTEI